MAYGRLDVSSPDGSIQIFALTEPTVSIGRSTGNTIILDNNTISRYHFKLSLDDGRVFITDLDSANGTFVDGVKLDGDAPRLLLDGDEITIGNLRIIYHDVDDTPTVKLKPLDDTTQRIEMALANFYIDIQGPAQSVAPGAYISAELVVTNTTEQDERFRVEVSGPPEDWVRIDRPTPLVAAGETVLVIINFKPVQDSSSKPGDYPVTVRVYPKNKPNDVLEAKLNLTVLPFGAFKMTLEKAALAAGDHFQLQLHNQGSSPLPIMLSGLSREQALDFRFAAAQITLAPGQKRVVEGEVRPKNRQLMGKPRTVHFDLIAQGQNHAGFLVPLRGSLSINPVLPGWALAASTVTLLAVSLILIVIVAVVLRRPPPQPQFTSFSINNSALARGDVLELAWQAEDVETLRLLVDGVVVTTLEPQLANYDLNTDSLSGTVVVALEGLNGDLMASRSAEIVIYEPMHVERFEVSPPQLYRYVVQGLDVSWNVPGASHTQVLGLEEFSAVVIAADGPSGSIPDIPGIPLEAIILTLVAEDNFGNMLEHSLTVNLLNPQCRPIGGPAQLYIGPGLNYQVVGTIPEAGSVIVDARNSDGSWLRIVGLAGLDSAWAQRPVLACDEGFSPDNLRVEINVPTPAPSATATLTASPSPTQPPAATATNTLVPLPSLTPSS